MVENKSRSLKNEMGRELKNQMAKFGYNLATFSAANSGHGLRRVPPTGTRSHLTTPRFTAVLSQLAFVFFSILVPLLVTYFAYCSNCELYQISDFELEVLVCQSVAAAISLLCISHNLRKYRVRKLLFVDRYHGQLSQFSELYLKKIRVFYYLVASWMTIFFLIKIAREITRAVYLYDGSVWWSTGIVVASLVSWAYSNIIFLVGTALFHLVGNLQVIHFEHFSELWKWIWISPVYINEHMRLTCYVCKISHSNDAAVSDFSSDGRNVETPKTVGQLSVNYSEGDLESADCMPPPANMQLTSTMSSYHKRQAFDILFKYLLLLWSYYPADLEQSQVGEALRQRESHKIKHFKFLRVDNTSAVGPILRSYGA
ncbi:hypothetical protein HAX54_009528 [Datura stramonium]|uniref:Uncharacterized protein n=1 Tax=Datura stramonium TaxID=4076 RepID=A0ABS8RWA7_DATST|nr:hypothetical protein [Datura stramonium]